MKSLLIHRQTLACILIGILAADCQAFQECRENFAVPSTPIEDFEFDDSRGIVIHRVTGLIWMRCSLGQTWDGQGSCKDFPKSYSWQDALKAAESFVFAGYSDWRLPNKNELTSILETQCVSPSINLKVFPNTPITYYWTSSNFVNNNQYAWSVHFNNSFVTNEYKSGALQVRLVRGGL